MNTNEARKMNTPETKNDNESCPLDAIVNPPCNEVLLMDCMEGMKQYPDKFFDIAIVDPPYGNGTKADVGTGEYSRNWLKNRNGDWDIRPADVYWEELRRVSKNQIVFGANFFPLPPSDEDIEVNFPSEVGQSVKMEKGKTYEETRLANYYRRQGARWMRDLISNDQ